VVDSLDALPEYRDGKLGTSRLRETIEKYKSDEKRARTGGSSRRLKKPAPGK
jgi:hypothetical protein